MSLLINYPCCNSTTWSQANIKSTYNVSPISPISLSSTRESKNPGIMSRSRLSQNESTHKPIHINSFEAYVVEKTISVNRVLEEPIIVEEPVKQLHESMSYSLLASDKRIRAALSIAACELVGGEEATAIPVACAVEMIHTGSSILADLPCVYNNGMRWGKPTNHRVFGENVAILGGHALLALAMEHLVDGCSKLGVPWERIVRAVGEIARCMGSDGLAYEQLANYVKRSRESELTGELNVNFHKPEALLEGSLVLGAIVGGAEDQEIAKLRDFARCIGPLFHKVDHLLGVTKSSQGKTEELSMESAATLIMNAKNNLAAAFDPKEAAALLALADFIAYSND